MSNLSLRSRHLSRDWPSLVDRPMDPSSDKKRPNRFRFRVYHLALVAAVCAAAFIYWWSTLEVGTELFSSRAQSVRIGKPLFWSSPDWSRSGDEELMRKAGADLRSRVVLRLQGNGFVKRQSDKVDSADVYIGNFRRSPRIELRIREYIGIDEGGVHYKLWADYLCSLPKGTAAYHREMTDLIKEFEGQLNSWIEDSRDDLLAENPEYR